MYVSSFTPIPFVLSKTWPGQQTNYEQKWLRGDNSNHIQGLLSTALPLNDTNIYTKFH